MALKGKVERAFQLVLEQSDELPTELRETADAPSKVFLGQDHEEQRRPCVVCWCQGGEEEPLYTGNRRMRLTVMVKSASDPVTNDDGSVNNPEEDHNARAQAVFGILKVDNLAQLLTDAVENFQVYDPVMETDSSPDIQNRSFTDALTFEVYCCDTDIAEQ